MADNAVTVRTHKFMRNPLLKRRQMVVEVLHPNVASVSKEDIKKHIAKMYKVKDSKSIILFGFQVAFGGGKSKGFGLIYDSVEDCKKFERKYRLARFGLDELKKQSRKMIKENKNRQKKVWGTGRRAAAHKARKADEE
ncbi:hypothetical protein WA158_004761 [Blastocystis sp. Blastoise]